MLTNNDNICDAVGGGEQRRTCLRRETVVVRMKHTGYSKSFLIVCCRCLRRRDR